MNESGEFQEMESNYSGQLFHVPSQPAVVPSPRSMLSRDQSLRSDTWNLYGTRKLLAIHEQQSIVKEFFTLRVKVLQVETPCRRVQGDLLRKVKNKLKPGISVCSRVIRLMNNQTKSQRKSTIPRKKQRQECSGYCENCTTIGLRLARLGCVGFSKRQTVPGKPDEKSLGINSKSTVPSSSKYPGKEKTIA